MAKIVTFYNHKGGVGKTTNTIISATNLKAHFGKKVAIIDADEGQWSTYRIFESQMKQYRESISTDELSDMFKSKKLVEYPVFRSYVNDKYKVDDSYTIDEIIEELDSECDYIFVDLGNRSLADFKFLFDKIDYFIIPFSRDPEEFIQAIKMHSLLKAEFPHVKPFFLMVKITKSEKDLEEFSQIKSNIENKFNINVFSIPILERKKYVFEHRSFFQPIRKEKEKKEEGKYSYIEFLKEFTTKIK